MELNPWNIRYGYMHGAFPMADDDGSISWYQVERRALFPISGIHVSRSLKKFFQAHRYRVSFDEAFRDVILSCRRPTDNWINSEIVRAYTEVHEMGWAHSCEVWEGQRLVGGIYGIAIGTCFCAESMFHRETNCSKLALWSMVERCRELGFTIFDAQVMNPHLASLGAYEVSRGEYEMLLDEALRGTTDWSG